MAPPASVQVMTVHRRMGMGWASAEAAAETDKDEVWCCGDDVSDDGAWRSGNLYRAALGGISIGHSEWWSGTVGD